MHKMGAVSVIIVNWNGEKFLSECFESLHKQIYQPSQIILTDNGSTDNSINFINKEYPETKIIALGSNLGFCKANNIAIRTVTTEYVALLNNDTAADPFWLFNLVQALESNPEAGFAASKMLFFDKPDKIDRAGDDYTTSATGLLRGRNHSVAQYDTSEYIFGACAGAALYRTHMLKDVGLFDEDFFLVYEDVDLSFRAQLRGYKCIFVPNAIVYHKVSGSIGQDSALSVYQSQRNLEWVYIKNMPKSLILKTIIPHLTYNIAAFFYFAAIGRIIPYIRAKIDAIIEIDKPLSKRRHIQREKCVEDDYISSLLHHEPLSHRLKSKFQLKNN